MYVTISKTYLKVLLLFQTLLLMDADIFVIQQ